jgi:hypothetical protein
MGSDIPRAHACSGCLAAGGRPAYSSDMRRWVVGASLLVAVLGLGTAFALPSSSVPDCPPPSTGHPCLYMTDTHPWIRFLIGAAGLVPASVVVGTRYHGNRLVATGVLVAGLVAAVLLWIIRGLVPTSAGDCLGYPQCYTMGRPYVGVGLAVVVLTLVAGVWLWEPNVEVGPGARQAH